MIDFPGPGLSQQQYLDLLAAGYETGFYDDHGNPAPWPDDLDEWRPVTGEPTPPEPGQPAF